MSDLSRVNSFTDIELKMFALKLVIETLDYYSDHEYIDAEADIKNIYPFSMTLQEKEVFFSKIRIRVEQLLYRLEYVYDYNTFDDISNVSTVLSFILNKIRRKHKRIDELNDKLDYYVSIMRSDLKGEYNRLHDD